MLLNISGKNIPYGINAKKLPNMFTLKFLKLTIPLIYPKVNNSPKHKKLSLLI